MSRMIHESYRAHIAAVLGMALILIGMPAWSKQLSKEPDYIKGEGPEDSKTPWALGSTGAHGYFYRRNPRVILVKSTDEGSPARGTLRIGDVILGVLYPTTGQDTGKGKFTMDARHSLAIAIEQAEQKQHRGKLVLNVWRPDGYVKTEMKGKRTKRPVQKFFPKKPRSGSQIKVTLKLKTLGTYSATSPWDCKKSEILVEMLAQNLLKKGFVNIQKKTRRIPKGIDAAMGVTGLLSTGEKKYIEHPQVKEYIQLITKRAEQLDIYGDKGINAWEGGYAMILLAEYYLMTKDESVLPGIRGISRFFALGVSGVGTYTHGVADVKLNGLYGPPGAYGAMNLAGEPCALGMVLAQKCGIKDPVVDKAVVLTLDFLRYYVDKGCIPYGDHAPKQKYHDNNGRMSVAAVLFDIVGEKKAAEYFTRMTLASYKNREVGHTGHFFGMHWGALGAARGGPEAAASFIKHTRYFTELERRYDGACIYQPQLPGGGRYMGWSTTGSRLLQFCLPRKALYITGKGGSSFTPITGSQLKTVEAAANFSARGRKTEELLKALEHGSMIVRKRAAVELGKKGVDVVDTLIALLDSPNRFARYGACVGLKFAGRNSNRAADLLATKIENDPDFTFRYFAIDALSMPPRDYGGRRGRNRGKTWMGLGKASRRATNSLLKVATIYDPKQDATRKLTRHIANCLFGRQHRDDQPTGLYENGAGIERVDKKLLIPALREMLKNPNGVARAQAGIALNRLPRKDLDQLWGEAYYALTSLPISGVMFTNPMPIVDVMAKHKIKEGVEFGVWYTFVKDGWGKGGRVYGMRNLKAYGAAMKPYFEHFNFWIGRLSRSRKGRDRKVAKGMKEWVAEMEKVSTVPKLTSIRDKINTKPQKLFLEWQAKQNDNKNK